MEQIGKAFKDEKFRDLFADYMREISDPKNKALYESEIKQLESQRGNDVAFLHPTPGFVAKTKVLNSGTEASKKLEGATKFFVNVCSHPEVNKPKVSGTVFNKDGSRKGQNWSIPYTLSKTRLDKDNGGSSVGVIDAIFHPEALEKTKSDARFVQLLVSTAFEGIKSSENIQLDLENWKRLNSQYKGPATSVFISKGSNKEGHLQPPSLAEIVNPKGGLPPTKLIEELDCSSVVEPEIRRVAPTVEPKYSVVHRKPIDMLDYTMDRNARDSSGTASLLISIELPKVNSATEAELDITERSLTLSVPDKYSLAIELPLPVNFEKGSAKFDKAKKLLLVDLPALQPAAKVQGEIPALDHGAKFSTAKLC